MPNNIIKMIKINNLQYNALRDRQVYRRVAGESFRIQLVVAVNAPVQVTLSDETGAVLVEGTASASGTFSHALTYATPGVRVVTVTARHEGRSDSQDLRLDVMAQAWVG